MYKGAAGTRISDGELRIFGRNIIYDFIAPVDYNTFIYSCIYILLSLVSVVFATRSRPFLCARRHIGVTLTLFDIYYPFDKISSRKC